MSFKIYIDPSPQQPSNIMRSHTLPSPSSLFSTLIPSLPPASSTSPTRIPTTTTDTSIPRTGKENVDPLTGLPATRKLPKSKSKSTSRSKQPLAPASAPTANKPKSKVKPPKHTADSSKPQLRKQKPAAKRPLSPSLRSPPPPAAAWPSPPLFDQTEHFNRLAQQLTVLPLADVSLAYAVQPQLEAEVDPTMIPLPESPKEDRIWRPFVTEAGTAQVEVHLELEKAGDGERPAKKQRLEGRKTLRRAVTSPLGRPVVGHQVGTVRATERTPHLPQLQIQPQPKLQSKNTSELGDTPSLPIWADLP
ncbi:hypothetical protein DACRYDRAFT_107301 [Dacryopinax primogenitus]|uniref:Uncharacterized protein n=1 Tax=Dacryopinax primogenitus (strain DJM 731) TaxID=1858805 RepID=M5G2D4_DACPD|nr:uncharacterized protein DACRYDRAFT_107301 [Dacryopinax primogenitus]EJU02375.1 hypothetical protein DACRYDRAFT_107301 [Dacryopinax primogenitus]